MIIDSHGHLEEEIPPERLIALMDRDGIQKAVVFAGAMERIPSTPDRLLSVFRFLLRSRLNGLGRTLYNSFVKQGNLMVSGKAYRIFPDPDNETVGQRVRENSDRLIFYAFINHPLIITHSEAQSISHNISSFLFDSVDEFRRIKGTSDEHHSKFSYITYLPFFEYRKEFLQLFVEKFFRHRHTCKENPHILHTA